MKLLKKPPAEGPEDAGAAAQTAPKASPGSGRMRIVHFSDIHVGRWTRDVSALFDKRLLGMANFLLRRRAQVNEPLIHLAVARIRGLSPDVVVCTGDLTCVGAPEEFAAARRLLQPLREDPAFEFFAVPGNHDAYVANPACVNARRETFEALNEDSVNLDDFPVEIRRGGVVLLFVQEAAPRGPLASSGELSAFSRQWLREQSDKPRGPAQRRIAVGHFPVRDASGAPLPRRRRLIGADTLAGLLDAGRIDAALCGHVHTPFRRDMPSGSFEVCAGALSIFGKLNVIDYCPDCGELVQHWEDVTGLSANPVGMARPLIPAEVGALPYCGVVGGETMTNEGDAHGC